jgi:hypothetical protein
VPDSIDNVDSIDNDALYRAITQRWYRVTGLGNQIADAGRANDPEKVRRLLRRVGKRARPQRPDVRPRPGRDQC